MTHPLLPLSPAEVNIKTPLTTRTIDQHSVERQLNVNESPSRTKHSVVDLFDESYQLDGEDTPSSPFIDEPVFRKSVSPIKNRSPEKRHSPFKLDHKSPQPSFIPQRCSPLNHNDDSRPISPLAADESVIHHDLPTVDRAVPDPDESSFACMDDTAFSTFSAIPNADMNTFTRLHEARPNPSQHDSSPIRVPPRSQSSTPCARPDLGFCESPSSSPTPRRRYHVSASSDEPSDPNDTTNLILDFTEQFNALASSSTSYKHTSTRDRSPAKHKQTGSDLASFARDARRTPSPTKRPLPIITPRERMNLLDFDITPAPTPRSLPTISARELESLKSGYLSQISSLKAGLSGKEAEVNSLKEAVGDAERRVGEAQEVVRAERGAKEALQSEREAWVKRGKEMETVMRGVKEELLRRERDEEGMRERLEESERGREEVEMRVREMETRLRAARAGEGRGSAEGPGGNGKEVDAAIEQVAMDLHASYKKKHESKVAALKRSYEKRWEKRVRELEGKVEEVQRENEELRVGRDTTMSGVHPGAMMSEAERENIAENAQRLEEHKARVMGLAEEVASVKRDNERLIVELEKERVEKGDMVAAVEEMLSLQAGLSSGNASVTATSGIENLRGSISRASGMRAPGFSGAPIGSGESRIGRIPVPGTSGLKRSGSGSGPGLSRSGGIMGNIERMGRGRIE